MSVLPHVYRTVGPLPLPVLANCLCDGQNVGLGECPMGGRAAVSTSAEAHELARIAEVRLALEKQYFERQPDLSDPSQLVSFGTSGHRGTPSHGTFTEAHILAITQAICEYRKGQGTDGPVYMGKDTHALSGIAQRTALEVLAANNVET